MKIRNKTTQNVVLGDLTGITISASSDLELDASIRMEMVDSISLKTNIDNGSIVIVNDADVELNMSQSTSCISNGFDVSSLYATKPLNDFGSEMGNYGGEARLISDTGNICFWNSVSNKWINPDGTELRTFIGGTGDAGTFTESFESISSFAINWSGDIVISAVNTETNGFWNVHDAGTPSNGTGATTVYNGTYMLYAECSGNANSNSFPLITSNFAKLTTISYRYNLYGGSTGAIKTSIYVNNAWVEVSSVSTVTNTNQWVLVSIDVTDMDAEQVKFNYEGATGYQGDCCLDYIQLVSV